MNNKTLLIWFANLNLEQKKEIYEYYKRMTEMNFILGVPNVSND